MTPNLKNSIAGATLAVLFASSAARADEKPSVNGPDDSGQAPQAARAAEAPDGGKQNGLLLYPIGLIFGRASMEYQRAVGSNQLAIGANYWSLDLGGTKLKAFGAEASYRFMLMGSPLNGFYVAPVAGFSAASGEVSHTVSGKAETVTASGFGVELGGDIGYQARFDRFIMNFNTGIGTVLRANATAKASDGTEVSVAMGGGVGWRGLGIGFGFTF